MFLFLDRGINHSWRNDGLSSNHFRKIYACRSGHHPVCHHDHTLCDNTRDAFLYQVDFIIVILVCMAANTITHELFILYDTTP